jgi:hypothetical protein
MFVDFEVLKIQEHCEIFNREYLSAENLFPVIVNNILLCNFNTGINFY